MIDLSEEALISLLLRSLCCGVALGVFYDALRFLKMLFGYDYFTGRSPLGKGKRALIFIVTFFSDLVFWITSGIVSIALMYTVGGGSFRGMTYMWLALGFAIYYFTLGRSALKLGAILSAFVKKTACAVLRLISIPLRFILGKVILIYHLTICNFIGKIKAVILSCRKKQEDKSESTAEQEAPTEGKEEFVHVNEGTGYRRESRFNFGNKSDRYVG